MNISLLLTIIALTKCTEMKSIFEFRHLPREYDLTRAADAMSKVSKVKFRPNELRKILKTHHIVLPNLFRAIKSLPQLSFFLPNNLPKMSLVGIRKKLVLIIFPTFLSFNTVKQVLLSIQMLKIQFIGIFPSYKKSLTKKLLSKFCN